MATDTEGKVILTGQRLHDLLEEMGESPCAIDCRVKIDMQGTDVNIVVHRCHGHPLCFIDNLRSMETMH